MIFALFAAAALAAGPAQPPLPAGPPPAVPKRVGVTLDRGLRPTPVSAVGDLLAWSRRDPRTRRWVLVARRGDRTEVLPVGSRGAAFDVDAGPGPDGAPTLVYSRCVREPRQESDEAAARPAAGCRIFAFSFATRQERPLARTHVPGGSESLPAIWRGRVAFVRTPLGGGRAELRVLDAAGGEERRPAGPARGFPAALDLRGRTVAVLWTGLADDVGAVGAQLRVQLTAQTRPRVVDQGFTGEECSYQPLAPVLGEREVRWVARSTSVYENPCARTNNVIRRLRLAPSAKPERGVPLGDAPVAAAPLTDGRLAVLAPRPGTAGTESHLLCASDRAPGANRCELRLVTPAAAKRR